MKTLELSKLDVIELTDVECERENGGWVWQAIEAAVLVISVGIYIYNNAGDFAAGWNEGKKASGY
jgi:hypothetical protein